MFKFWGELSDGYDESNYLSLKMGQNYKKNILKGKLNMYNIDGGIDR